MSRHRETNPHFAAAPRDQESHIQLPVTGVASPPPQHHDQQNQLPVTGVAPLHLQDQQNQPPDGPWPPQEQPQPQADRRPQRSGTFSPWFSPALPPGVTEPLPPHAQQPSSSLLPRSKTRPQRTQTFSPWFSPALPPGVTEPLPPRAQQPSSSLFPRSKKPKRQDTKRPDRRNQPLGPWAMLPERPDQHIQPPGPSRQQPQPGSQETQPLTPSQHPKSHISPPLVIQQPPHTSPPQVIQPQHQGPGLSQPHSPPVVPPPHHGRSQSHSPQVVPPPHHGRSQPHGSPFEVPPPHHQDHHRRKPHGLRVPSERRTKLITWFLAGFCAIFWVVIILGGLIVLIVYLIFRPHSPKFNVSSVTLNAAYLDMGILLNSDLTVLANFTNPNRKVKVDFSYVVLDLYYGRTLIASQYVEPFKAASAQSRLAHVHLVTSQVRLPLADSQRLKKQVESNAVVFEIKGVFRARSNLGSFLRYSYWLYGHCTVVVTSPPDGVIRASRCRTKR